MKYMEMNDKRVLLKKMYDLDFIQENESMRTMYNTLLQATIRPDAMIKFLKEEYDHNIKGTKEMEGISENLVKFYNDRNLVVQMWITFLLG